MQPAHDDAPPFGGGGSGEWAGLQKVEQFRKYLQDKAEMHTHRLWDGQTDAVIPVYPANFVTGSPKRLLTSMRCDGNSLKWAMADTC